MRSRGAGATRPSTCVMRDRGPTTLPRECMRRRRELVRRRRGDCQAERARAARCSAALLSRGGLARRRAGRAAGDALVRRGRAVADACAHGARQGRRLHRRHLLRHRPRLSGMYRPGAPRVRMTLCKHDPHGGRLANPRCNLRIPEEDPDGPFFSMRRYQRSAASSLALVCCAGRRRCECPSAGGPTADQARLGAARRGRRLPSLAPRRASDRAQHAARRDGDAGDLASATRCAVAAAVGSARRCCLLCMQCMAPGALDSTPVHLLRIRHPPLCAHPSWPSRHLHFCKTSSRPRDQRCAWRQMSKGHAHLNAALSAPRASRL